MIFDLDKRYLINGMKSKIIHTNPDGSMIAVTEKGVAGFVPAGTQVSEWEDPVEVSAVVWLRSRAAPEGANEKRASLTRHFLAGREWSPVQKPGFSIRLELSAREAP